jgi:nucleoside-specific outer membrane channel protein Tsx
MYNNDGVEVYAEIYSSLSLSKMSSAEVAFGPIKDVSIMFWA